MKHVAVAAAILAALGMVLSLLANAGMWLQLQRLDAVQRETTARAQMQQAGLSRDLAASRQALDDLRTRFERESANHEKRLADLTAPHDTPQAAPPPVLDLGGFGRRQAFVPPPFIVNEFKPLNGRAWGPEQATGAPDTLTAGDQQTAWASRSQDDQEEWLQLEYDQTVTIAKVKVYETYNPGALFRITVVDDAGKENEVWQGKDPTPIGAPMGTSEVTLPVPTKGNRVKIYLDSVHVPGWNEIDAVGIVDDQNAVHWAVRATASSTYAEQGLALPEPVKPVKPPRKPENDAF